MGERVKEEDIRERTNEVENRVQDTRTMVYLPGQTARRRPPTKPADLLGIHIQVYIRIFMNEVPGRFHSVRFLELTARRYFKTTLKFEVKSHFAADTRIINGLVVKIYV